VEAENRNLLIDGVKVFGIELDEKTVDAFDLYSMELLKWNRKINLTAVREEKEVVLKHFIDSLSVFSHLPESGSLFDVGSGAGFPGIPLKMVNPRLYVTLIDSVQKKVDFQNHIIRALGLKEIEAIHGRIQDQEVLQRYEGQFDVVISRAFSDLQTFLSLTYPFLKKGGMAVAMKGRGLKEELRLISERERVSYQLKKDHTFLLPFSPYRRSILVFEKRSP